MKNILLLFSFMLIAGMGYSQIKVLSNGDVQLDNTTPATSRAALDMNSNFTNRPNAQFGGFGIQSYTSTNGFLTSNGRFDGGAMRTYDTGGMALIQFINGTARFRTLPSTAAETRQTTIFENIVCRNNGTIPQVGINTVNPQYELHVFGNAAKTSGGDTWTIPSDKRLKKNIKKSKFGLETILKINPVQYEYNGKAGTQAGEFQVGVIAQELQEVAPYMVTQYNYQAEDKDSRSALPSESKASVEEYLGVNASALKWVLVNAIKEQQSIIDDLTLKVSDLTDKIEEIGRNQILSNGEGNRELIELGNNGEPYISQNIPNPSVNLTSVKYFIPSNTNSAQINVYSLDGKLVTSKNIDHRGSGEIDFEISNLVSGEYIYNLSIDGKIYDTKKMVKVK